ncbi:MAG: BatD family protein, partial [Spirochaetes bacterium]|nr:BatD family protein [Spirochaetota bacterium]
MKKTGSYLLMLILFCAYLLYAQGNAYPSDEIVNIHASVDAVKVGLLDTINLTVTVDIEGTARVPNPLLPELEAFTVLSESTKSQTSISIVNGQTKRTKTITHTYLVQPNLKGVFIIEPVT